MENEGNFQWFSASATTINAKLPILMSFLLCVTVCKHEHKDWNITLRFHQLLKWTVTNIEASDDHSTRQNSSDNKIQSGTATEMDDYIRQYAVRTIKLNCETSLSTVNGLN